METPPYWTAPDPAGETQVPTAQATPEGSGRVRNAWQEDRYRDLPETREGREILTVYDRDTFRSTQQQSYTDEHTRNQYASEDAQALEARAPEQVADPAEGDIKLRPLAAVWSRACEPVRESASVQGGCGRGRSCVMKDVYPSRADLVRAKHEQKAPWSRAISKIIDEDDVNLSAAWAAAATTTASHAGGRRFIADHSEGRHETPGKALSAQSAPGSVGRGQICHVGTVKSNVGKCLVCSGE